MIPGKDGMLQSRAVLGQNRSWKREDAAEESSSWIEIFLEKTECCRAQQFLYRIDSWKRRDAADQSSSWIDRFLENTGCCRAEQQFVSGIYFGKTNDAAEQSNSQMEYIPGIVGMLHRAEQFLDRIDSWKRRDAAEQSSSWIEQIPGKYEMLQSTAAPRQNRFLKKRKAAEHSSSWIEYILEKRGCCRADQFLDRKIPGKDRMLQSRAVPGQKDSWKREDAAEQSGSWIDWIPGKDRMMHRRAVPGQNRFVEKTGCYLAEKVVEQSNMWKGEKISFTFNMFFFLQKWKRNPLYCLLKCK